MNKILRAYPPVNLGTPSKLLTSPQINHQKDDKNDSWHAKFDHSIYLYSIIPPMHVFMRYHCVPFIVSIGAKTCTPLRTLDASLLAPDLGSSCHLFGWGYISLK